MKMNLELKEINVNEKNIIDEWVERANKKNKFVEEWERKIVEGTTAI